MLRPRQLDLELRRRRFQKGSRPRPIAEPEGDDLDPMGKVEGN